MAVRRFADYGGVQRAHGVYELLSLVAHPNLTALASVQTPVPRDGFTEYRYQLDLKEAIWPLHLAATFLYRAGAVVCSYFQLDDTPLESFADALPAIDRGA